LTAYQHLSPCKYPPGAVAPEGGTPKPPPKCHRRLLVRSSLAASPSGAEPALADIRVVPIAGGRVFPMLLAKLRVVPCDWGATSCSHRRSVDREPTLDVLFRTGFAGDGICVGTTQSGDRFVVSEGAPACVEGPRDVGPEWPGGPGIDPGSEGDAE
jgi:hypothetical protein